MSINVSGSAQVAYAQQNHLSNRSTSAIVIVSPALQLFHSKQNNILIALLRRVALDADSAMQPKQIETLIETLRSEALRKCARVQATVVSRVMLRAAPESDTYVA